MSEMKIIPGKHKCGNIMDMRILSDNESKKLDRHFWIIYGICNKCELVLVISIFMDNHPVINVDYIIDYDKMIDGEKLNKGDGK